MVGTGKFLKKVELVKSPLTRCSLLSGKREGIMADRPPTKGQFGGSCCAHYATTMRACSLVPKLPGALSLVPKEKTSVGCLF